MAVSISCRCVSHKICPHSQFDMVCREGTCLSYLLPAGGTCTASLMPCSYQERIRGLAARRTEAQSYPLSDGNLQLLRSLQTTLAHVQAADHEKVLCLCHTCDERTFALIEDPSRLRKPHWVVKATCLRHIKDQCDLQDSTAAALGKVLIATRSLDGMRYLTLPYYKTLAEASLRISGHDASAGPSAALSAAAAVVEDRSYTQPTLDPESVPDDGSPELELPAHVSLTQCLFDWKTPFSLRSASIQVAQESL